MARLGARRRLLHDASEIEAPVLVCDVEHAVAGHVLTAEVFGGQDRLPGHPVSGQQLRRDVRGPEQIVGEGHHHRVVTGEVPRQQQRVARAAHLRLTDHRDVQLRWARLLQLRGGSLGREHRVELRIPVEPVLDGALAAAGDQQHVLDARVDELLDHQIDGGPVDHRQQLLGHHPGDRQEARAVARSNDDALHRHPGSSIDRDLACPAHDAPRRPAWGASSVSWCCNHRSGSRRVRAMRSRPAPQPRQAVRMLR